MFRVRLIKYINPSYFDDGTPVDQPSAFRLNDIQGAVLEIRRELPFAPVVGLVISFGRFAETIECVVWEVDDSEFRCKVETQRVDVELGQAGIRSEVAYHTAHGWSEIEIPNVSNDERTRLGLA